MCVCVCVLSFYFCPKCIVKMCHLLTMHLSRCIIFGQGALCVCVCMCVCVCVLYQEGNIRSTFKVTGGSTAIMKLSTENGWIM